MAWASWYTSFSDAFKKRAGRYLINKYLGTFLDDTISLDQLSVDGAISLSNVALNIRTINCLIEEADLPVEFVDGHIEHLSVTIPWTDLLTESCHFTITGLTVTLQVKKRANPAQISASIFHSMCESFSSFSVAEECLKAEDVQASPGKKRPRAPGSEEDAVAGVELLAQAIDSVIMRVQVQLTRSAVRLEYLPGLEQRGIALELQIGRIAYTGEPAGQPAEDAAFSTTTVRRVCLEDVALLTDEFQLQGAGLHSSPCTSLHSSRTASVSPNADRGPSRDFVWQGLAPGEREEVVRRRAEQEERERREREEQDLPLQLATLAGRQEIVLKFTEMNQFGLPRAVDEVEVGLGRLLLHLFPHQVHILSEILSAVTVPASRPAPGPPPRQPRHGVQGLEGLLQENLRLGGPALHGLNLGWGEMEESGREFLPVEAGAPARPGAPSPPEPDPPGPPPMPRILVRLAGCLAVVQERDPGVARLGGEPSRPLALRAMRQTAAALLSAPGPQDLAVWDPRRLAAWHRDLGASLGSSHIQVLASPVSVVYQEGTAIGPGLASTYAALTTVTLGKVSVVEWLAGEEGQEPETVPLLGFTHSQETDRSRKSPDVKVVYKDTLDPAATSLTISLAPCSLSLDPGLLDRTYLLLHYAEMDPDCVRTVAPPPPAHGPSPSLSVSLSCPAASIAFHVPRPDMRGPEEAGGDLLRTLWGRAVHPEVFLIQLQDLGLRVAQEGAGLSPLVIGLTASAVEVAYQEGAATQPFCLVQARRLQQARDRLTKSHALELTVTVCMDESLRLQGRYNSRQQRMERSVWRRPGGGGGSPEEETEGYFVVDPEAGPRAGGEGGSRPSFLQQQGDILAALRQAALRNNLLIDIKLDAVSLVVPGKRLYEVVYNRLGNDLLLWLPQYLMVKQHLYGELAPDPLHDDTSEFSAGFQGRPEALEAGPRGGRGRSTTAFPKDRETGALEIHTDTAVLLSVHQAQVLVCVPMEAEQLGLLHLSGVGLHLTSAVGLDRDPEISLFTLNLSEGCVKYGLCPRDQLPAQLHFNPSIPGLEVLLTTNSYCDRAWPEPLADTELLSLTGKVLLDTATNLKSIQLAFQLARVGLCVRDAALAPDWIAALADFFTVVEFPVLGYVPPAVLSELHFQLLQCAVEVTPPAAAPATAALCIGKASVSCSLLDTTKDASVSVSLEDVALYLAKEAGEEAAICVADTDYLDLGVTLSEPEGAGEREPTLLVTASANMVRLRTCADTLQLLAELGAGLAPPEAPEPPGEEEAEGEDATLAGNTEDMLPDLEDAMVELTEAGRAEEEEEKRRREGSGGRGSAEAAPGAQLFFFPGEQQSAGLLPPPRPPGLDTLLLQVPGAESSGDEEDLESFCILEEEEGSGIVPSGGGPGVRLLAPEGILLVDDHFAVPEAQVDHLRGPKGFPNPQLKLALTRLSLVWQIFGGNDFSESKEMRCNTRANLEQSGLCLSPGGGPHRRRPQAAVPTALNSAMAAADRLKTRGGPGRNHDLLIELVVNKMAAQLEVYPWLEEPDCPVSRQILLLPSLEVRDKLVGSEINKMLHPHSSKTRPRQSSASMLHVKCLSVRPDPASSLEEASLKVSLQPFRLNIDQDTLFFIIDFANTLMPAEPSPEAGVGEPGPRAPGPASGQARFQSGMAAIQIEVPEGAEVFEDARSSPPKSPSAEPEREKSATPGGSAAVPSIYFKSFIFSPAVPIRIDYVGKYVDFTQGAVTGILAGLAQLNCSELTLKQLEFKQGVLGLDKLMALAATAWLADIRSSQLPALLGGVGPMHALLQLLVGVRDLILLPIEQYRKDGRIVRGLQRGTTSFTHSTTLSFLDVTNKMLTVIKFAAELAFDVMSPDGCVVQGKLPQPDSRGCKRKAGRSAVRRARGTPADLREGMIGAMALVREGLDETARSLSDAAMDGRGGLGALGGVLRAVPSTMVRPIILGAAASSNLLDGMKNQISPDQRAEEEDKWRMS